MKQRIKKSFIFQFLIISTLLSISGCTKDKLTNVKQGVDNWLVFEVAANGSQQPELSWNFELTHAGKYDVQILSALPDTHSEIEAENDSESEAEQDTVPKVNVAIDGKTMAASLKQRF